MLLLLVYPCECLLVHALDTLLLVCMPAPAQRVL